MIEPGDTKTEFTSNRVMVQKAADSRYKDIMTASVQKMEKDEQNGTSPQTAAKLVYKMINKKNPPVRRAVGFSYQFLVFMKRLLPDKLILWILGKMYA
jgi:short-subunit dehydrogenase